ncbi:MAG: hypothetical protein VXW32_10660, partial [Myxococcota bacterium]|nr:hypothetical protein [Myxococcota bacterium]
MGAVRTLGLVGVLAVLTLPLTARGRRGLALSVLPLALVALGAGVLATVGGRSSLSRWPSLVAVLTAAMVLTLALAAVLTAALVLTLALAAVLTAALVLTLALVAVLTAALVLTLALVAVLASALVLTLALVAVL